MKHEFAFAHSFVEGKVLHNGREREKRNSCRKNSSAAGSALVRICEFYANAVLFSFLGIDDVAENLENGGRQYLRLFQTSWVCSAFVENTVKIDGGDYTQWRGVIVSTSAEKYYIR